MCVLDYVEMFRGKVSQTSVYPREVVRDAQLLVHNHPSGVADPSRADEVLTQTLKQAAALIDVRGAGPLHRRGQRGAVDGRTRARLSHGPSGPFFFCWRPATRSS